jgi:hypothetical protein
MNDDYFVNITREMFIASIEMLKTSEPGTPEFELAFQMLATYKIYVDRKAGRIIERTRHLNEN